MRLIPYLRVSTTSQADDGFGLEAQLVACMSLSAGHEILDPSQDIGVSGASDLDNRPGLAEALGRLAAGEGDGIVVYRLDRLARDLIVQEQLLAEVWRHGAIISCDEGETSMIQPDSQTDPSRHHDPADSRRRRSVRASPH